jgi:hypothetical protein
MIVFVAPLSTPIAPHSVALLRPCCERPWDRRGVRLDLRVSSAHVIGPSISRLLFLKNYPCASHAARNAALARRSGAGPAKVAQTAADVSWSAENP